MGQGLGPQAEADLQDLPLLQGKAGQGVAGGLVDLEGPFGKGQVPDPLAGQVGREGEEVLPGL
jgi:hypothetical protein